MDLIETVRATRVPGRQGKESPYAQAVYKYYAEIKQLKTEGFTFRTICQTLEDVAELPKNSDPISFRQAFQREVKRRKQATITIETVPEQSTKQNLLQTQKDADKKNELNQEGKTEIENKEQSTSIKKIESAENKVEKPKNRVLYADRPIIGKDGNLYRIDPNTGAEIFDIKPINS